MNSARGSLRPGSAVTNVCNGSKRTLEDKGRDNVPSSPDAEWIDAAVRGKTRPYSTAQRRFPATSRRWNISNIPLIGLLA
jgi:hypothetical protein